MNTFNAYKVPAPMELQNGFEDLCASLNGRSVEYLIVGGYALAFHGAPRFTGDIDIFVRPAPDNIDRPLTALVYIHDGRRRGRKPWYNSSKLNALREVGALNVGFTTSLF